ncbi:MAG: hypothetical protein H6747_08080 [Deltaproteobacteria bacterium]|nr:hypothetical protein [Deltaproteobacteria bacterium]
MSRPCTTRWLAVAAAVWIGGCAVEPDDAATAVPPELSLGAAELEVGALQLGAEIRVRVPLVGDGEAGPVLLALRDPASTARCTLGSLDVVTNGAERQAEGEVRVGADCAALRGVAGVELVAAMPRPSSTLVAPPTTCARDLRGGCEALRVTDAVEPGPRVESARLDSNLVLLFTPPELPSASAATPGVGTPGDAAFRLPAAAVDPAAMAPSLPATVIRGSARLSAAEPGAASSDAPALSIRIRSAEGDADWQPLAEDDTLAVASWAEAAGTVGQVREVPFSLSLGATTRAALLDGPWKATSLLQLRVCPATAEAAGVGSIDASAAEGRCVTLPVALARIAQGLPELAPAGAEPQTGADYFEIGKKESSGSALLQLHRFRGGFREVVAGHVRFGGVMWARITSSIPAFSLPIDKVIELRVWHDTAPVAADIVTASISLVGLPSIPLPTFEVPDSFQIAIQTQADTSGASVSFDATADLGSLLDKLSFTNDALSLPGLKFCVIGDKVCIDVAFEIKASVKTGLGIAKGVAQPTCTTVGDLGCYAGEGETGSFWDHAAACFAKGAFLPPSPTDASKRALQRSFANALGTPFYLGLQRPGVDYTYLMSQGFFEQNWKSLGVGPAALPTWWAFLDASIFVKESGACAVQAPDTYTSAMRVEYGTESVAKAAVANPAIRDLASSAHVPCQALLPRVCAYPVDGNGKLQYEYNEVFVRFVGQLSLEGSLHKGFGIEGVGAWGTVDMKGTLLTTTFAATIGQRWHAAKTTSGAWRTKGAAFGSVALQGQLGSIDVSGSGCLRFGVPKCDFLGPISSVCNVVQHTECLSFSLGGLTKLLPLTEIGASFAAQGLAFDVITEAAP